LDRHKPDGAGITAVAMVSVRLLTYGGYFLVAGAIHSVITSPERPTVHPRGPVVTTPQGKS
jgi:hypothetical protein